MTIFPSIELLWCLCKNQLTGQLCVYFWTLSIPLIYLSILTATPWCLDYCNFYNRFWNQVVNPLTLFLYFKVILAILHPFHFHINFTNNSVNFYKKESALLCLGSPSFVLWFWQCLQTEVWTTVGLTSWISFLSWIIVLCYQISKSNIWCFIYFV